MNQSPTSLARLLRSPLLSRIVALACLGWAIGFALQEETPLGSVRGQVILEDTGKTLSDVKVVLDPISVEGAGATRMAKTDASGKFYVSRLPAGDYNISASTHAHQSSEARLSVSEKGVTQLTLNMTRSQDAFAINQHQKVFGTAEKAGLPVSGYVDASRANGKDILRMELYRTRLSRLTGDAQAMQNLESGESGLELLKQKDSLGMIRILQTAEPIKEGDREGFFYKRLNFGALKSGLYLVSLEHIGQKRAAWMLVTDTAVVLKKAGTQMVAYAVNMQSGQPLEGCEVRSYKGGKLLAQGRTDSRGLVEINREALGRQQESGNNNSQLVTLAVHGEDEALVRAWDYNDESGGEFAVHAYTDRPIYRPGQRIYFKGIARRRLHPTPVPATRENEPASVQEAALYSVPTGEQVDVEIRDPSGERIYRERLPSNAHGSFSGFVDLLAEAPTGVYTMLMKIRGQEHTHDIVIASYKKPEYAVKVTADKPRYNRGETVRMTISGQYYFGTPVAGAKVTYMVYRAPDWAASYPAEYDYDPEYDTEESGHSYGGESVVEGKTTLDEDGKAVIEFKAETSPEEEVVQESVFTLTATVTDSADREVMEEGTARMVPGDFRLTVSPVGYLAAPGQATEVLVQARDYEGKPIANLPVELESANDVWEKDKHAQEVVSKQQASTDSLGRAIVPVTPPRAGYFRLKARAHDGKNRMIVGQASLWAVGDTGGDLQTEYADLAVLTDKRRYEPGETARVLINAARTGQMVLVTVEGERVYKTQLVRMKQKSAVVRIPIRAEYGPNVFLAACYVSNKHIAQSQTALRVSVPQRQIHVAIHADRDSSGATQGQLARYQPGEKISYTVQTTDLKGRPVSAEFSFGVVDEAIYALREDSPEAMRDDFYPRRSNRVSTQYSFAVEYLGDADKAEPKIVARKKFPDTAFWQPVLRTDSQGRATVQFALPDSLTTWRATATAHTDDTRLGRSIQKVMVSRDFFVRVEIPRFLTQKDVSQVMAIVHNETGAAQTALVRLKAENLTLSGDETRTVNIEPGKTAEVIWPVTATGIGDAKLRVTAWTPKNGGTQYTDGVETSLPIRAHGREVVAAFAGEVSGSGPKTEVLRLDPAAIPQVSRVTVRITPSVVQSLTGALDYLIGFPYGCTEQTMSRFLPDLLVQRVARTRGLAAVPRQAELPRMVREGLQRLYRFQHSDTGGWGWWENDPNDPWMTAYVLYGLSAAKAEGYPVSEKVLENGRKGAMAALKTLAEQLARPAMRDSARAGEVSQVEKERVFLIYALALTGGKPQAQAELAKVRLEKLGAEGLAYVVLTDILLGQSPGTALSLLNGKAVSADSMVHWTGGMTDYSNSSGNDVTATAVALRAVLAVNPKDTRVPPILRWLMSKRSGDYWISTRDTSWVLAALCDFLATQPNAEAGGSVVVSLNGSPIQTYALTPDLMKEREIVLRIPTSQLKPDRNEITLERRDGNTPVFYSVEMRQTVAMEDIPASSPSQITIQREYLRVKPKKAGSDYWSLQTEPTDNRLTVGDKIRIRLTLTVPRDMAYVLIEDPFPSGCEVTERGMTDDVVQWSYWWSSIDIRDDRVAFFARSLQKGKHVIEYNLRAQTPGTFHTLPTLLQGMYSPETRSESAEARIEVTK